jgi:RND family efflux transporter MFP subunit
MPRQIRFALPIAVAALTLAACGGDEPPPPSAETAPVPSAGMVVTVADTTFTGAVRAAGTAAPLQQATLSTKLMATVTAVLVREGDVVRAGQPLVRLDARDLAAKQAQVGAGIAEAEAMYRDASVQAARIRGLYADSAATRAQLDAVEVGLARAEAGVRAARAGAAELGAISDYSVVRAPFARVVPSRFVDPGAFAAPGAPLVSVQDASALRVSVSAPPAAVRTLRRGAAIEAMVEGTPMRATVEGVVPSGGNLYTVNAIIPNRDGRLLAGSAATLALPSGAGERRGLLVPRVAIRREGDLTGVLLRGADGRETLRWVRLGGEYGSRVEVTAGLRAGDQVLVPALSAARE